MARVGIIFVALVGLWGCGQGSKVPVVEVQPGRSPLERAKAILNDYVQGAPFGSEAMGFDDIVADVRKTDPQKATILEKGFADIKRSPRDAGAKARVLLKQL
jgi:hypothetical protein